MIRIFEDLAAQYQTQYSQTLQAMWNAPLTDNAQLFFWIAITLVGFLLALSAVDWKRAREECKACPDEDDTPQEKKGKDIP